jgi:membrane protease YdiL (CAAX protease family)
MGGRHGSTAAVDTRLVASFVALTVAISWGGIAALVVADVDVAGAGRGIGTLVFMGAPAVAALGLRGLRREPIRAGTGLFLGRVRWLVLAWLTPVGLTAAMVAVGVALPDTSFATEYAAFLLDLGFTETAAADTVADLAATGLPVVVVLTGLGLALGATLFALAALGEELGWRGLLLTELAPLGFWRLSLLTGVVWGLWHTPLVWLGLQFPEAPLAGILTLTAATVALSPVYTYLTVRAGSVLAPILLHGSFVLGGFTGVFLAGGSDLVVSSFGLVGIVAALLGTAACVAHDRRRAGDPITTGDPLEPWARPES